MFQGVPFNLYLILDYCILLNISITFAGKMCLNLLNIQLLDSSSIFINIYLFIFQGQK